jgi:hypothetical protein
VSIVYSTTVAQARLQVVLDAIDGGSGAGYLAVGTSALSGSTGLLFTVTLSDPVGTISGRVLTFSSMPHDATATGAGNAAKAELRDSSDVVVANGLSVSTAGSGADVIIDSVSIVVGKPVRLLSASITHP